MEIVERRIMRDFKLGEISWVEIYSPITVQGKKGFFKTRHKPTTSIGQAIERHQEALLKNRRMI